jgi:hypothetical protein
MTRKEAIVESAKTGCNVEWDEPSDDGSSGEMGLAFPCGCMEVQPYLLYTDEGGKSVCDITSRSYDVECEKCLNTPLPE